VLVDAHILAAPAVADLDGDGWPELVVPVTYYFDPYVSGDVGERTRQKKRQRGRYIGLGA
jgi:hypothetical protein